MKRLKKHILVLLTITLLVPCLCIVPSQKVEASPFSDFWNNTKSWASNTWDTVKDAASTSWDWVTGWFTNDEEQARKDRTAQSDKVEEKAGIKSSNTAKTSKVTSSVDVDSATSDGSGVADSDLSDITMQTTVSYSAFQIHLSRFVSLITVFGGFYLGVSVLRSLGMFIINIAQLSMIPNFPKARYFLIKNLMVSVVCIALLGSVGLLVQLVSGIVFS